MAELDLDDTASINNPYVGPRTFKTGEILFGRDRETRDLTALIISHRLVLFYAPSGAGKSSLINTKITPNLVAQGFEVLPVARVGGHTIVEGVHNVFTNNLITGLNQEKKLPPQFGSLTLSRFLDNLVELDGEYIYEEDYTYPDSAALRPRVLIIDQFEEILTTNTGLADHREEFLQQLNEAITVDPDLWVLLAMRDDFIAGLDPYLHYLPDRLRNRFYMQRLNRDAALEAVCRPAEKAGRPFESAASEMLVDNLRLIKRTEDSANKEYLEYVEPVQLQAVCFQMWEKLKTQPGAVISTADVEQYADVDMALTSFYEETVAATVAETGVSEIDLRNWFEQWFITDAGTRDMVFRGQQFTGDLPTPIADDVRGRFILRSVVRQEGIWYELVHDRLVSPIKSANRNWRLDQPLLSLAQHWEDADRSPERLLDGRQLDRFLATDWEALGTLVAAFVEASMEVRRQEQEKEAALKELERQQKLEQQRALAEAERARADSEHLRAEEAEKAKIRQRTLMGIVIGLLVIGAIVTSFLAYQALKQRDLAKKNEQTAISEAALAEGNEQIAKENEALAKAETIRANENLQAAEVAQENAEREKERADLNAQAASDLLALTEVQSLTDKTNSLRVGSHANDELSVLLGLEALRLKDELNIVDNLLAARANTALRNVLQIQDFSTVVADDDIAVNAIAIAPDGRTLASGGSDSILSLLDLTKMGSEPLLLEGPAGEITAVAFSPDGSYVAATGIEEILLWDMNDLDAEPQVFPGHSGTWVNSLAFSPDGASLASAADDATVKLWTVADVDRPPLVLNAQEAVWSVAFSPDGQSVAGGDAAGLVQLWNLAGDEAEPRNFEGHTDVVYSLAFAPDGSTLASGSGDWDIRLWDLNSPRNESQILRGHQGSVSSIAFSSDGETLASGSDDNNVHLWNRALDEEPLILRGHSDAVRSVAFSPDNSSLASGSQDGTIRMWDLTDQKQEPQVLRGHRDWVRSIAVSDDGTTLASASDDNTVRLWNLDNPAAQPRILAHDDWVMAVALSAAGDKLASGTALGQLLLWDLADPESEPQVVEAHSGWVSSITFSRDGRTLATTGSDGAVRLWDPDHLRAGSQQLAGVNDQEIYSLAISNDSSKLASAGADEKVRVWNLNNPYQSPRELKGHDSSINDVAFAPDGNVLASGGSDASVILWDLSSADGAPQVLQGHASWVTSVAFSPDGRSLASGSGDTTILLWDLADLEAEPQLLEGHLDAVQDVAFGPDSKMLASGSTDGTVRLWRTSVDQLRAIACDRVERNLTWQEAQEHLVTEDVYHVTCPNLPIHSSVAYGLSAESSDQRWPQIESFLADLWGKNPASAYQLTRQLPAALADQAYDQALNGQYEEVEALIDEAQQIDAQVDLAFVGEGMAYGWDYGQAEGRVSRINSFITTLAAEHPQIAAAFEQQIPQVLIEHASDFALEGEKSADEQALALISDAQELDPAVIAFDVGFSFAESWRERDWQAADRLQKIEAMANALRARDDGAALAFEYSMADFLVEQAQESAALGENQQALALVADAYELDPQVEAAVVGLALADNWPADSGADQINSFAAELAEKAPTVAGPFQEQMAVVLVNNAVELVWAGQKDQAFSTVDLAQNLHAQVDTGAVGQALAVNWDEWETEDRLAVVEAYVDEIGSAYPLIAERFMAQIPLEFVLHAADLVYTGDVPGALTLAAEAKVLDEGVGTSQVGLALAETWSDWDNFNRVRSVETFISDLEREFPQAAAQFAAEIPNVFLNRAAEVASSDMETTFDLMAEAQQLNPEIDISSVGTALAASLSTLEIDTLREQIAVIEEVLLNDFPEAARSFRQGIPLVLAGNARDLAADSEFERALALMAEVKKSAPSADLSGLGGAFAQGWLDWDPTTIAASITLIYDQLAVVDPLAAGQFQLALSTALVDRVHLLAQEEQDQEALALSEAVDRLDAHIWGQTADDMVIATASGLVRAGQVEQGLTIFETLQKANAELIVNAKQFNRFCWFGTLWGFPARVRSYCKQAVDLQPEDGNYRDSRGVMLAMLGEYKAAIESFEFYITWAEERGWPEERVAKRREWIAALESQINPFNAQLRASLRDE